MIRNGTKKAIEGAIRNFKSCLDIKIAILRIAIDKNIIIRI
jgi:hypothetical protein